MRHPSPKQKWCLEYIAMSLHCERRPPTVKEIAEAMETQDLTAYYLLLELERKGLIMRDTKFDSMRITEAGRKVLQEVENDTV